MKICCATTRTGGALVDPVECLADASAAVGCHNPRNGNRIGRLQLDQAAVSWGRAQPPGGHQEEGLRPDVRQCQGILGRELLPGLTTAQQDLHLGFPAVLPDSLD